MKELRKDLTPDSGFPEVRRVVVGEEAENQRVDNWLMRQLKGVPKSHIYRILRSGEVRVNGGRVDATYRLQPADEVRIPPVRVAAPEDSRPVPGRDFKVVFEDEWLLVLDKPAGLAVHGGSGVSFGVIEQLRSARPEARFLELAHRLDRETSGLLLVGKRRSSLTRLHDLMREGGMEKRYLALVRGRWMNPMQHVRLPLKKYLLENGERRVEVHPEGKLSHSIVRLVARWQNYSLLEVELKTGRTHQIRVHLSHLGFPLCGDDKYGDFALNKALQKEGLKRMFLHAARIVLPHPQTGERLELAVDLPEDLRAFIEILDGIESRDYGQAL
jgi:23S rRNA pseudouridine955/2504/2580 synthase